jgi:hypothetical protein
LAKILRLLLDSVTALGRVILWVVGLIMVEDLVIKVTMVEVLVMATAMVVAKVKVRGLDG